MGSGLGGVMAEGGRRLVVPGDSEDVEEKLAGRGAEDAEALPHLSLQQPSRGLMRAEV